MARVTVVGAGVVGLTSAVALQRAGHDVRVVAAKSGLESTSGAAGAIWLPVRIAPGGREFTWAMRGYKVLHEIARTTPAAGVDVLTACEVVEDEGRPWWADAVDGLELIPGGDLYPSAALFWSFLAPRVEPAMYMPWLEGQLMHSIEWREVASLAEVEGDLVVNCTGLGARRLCGDDELVGVLGQTVIVAPGELRMDTFIGDERDQSAIFYSIPRRGEVVLGGCRIEVNGDVVPPPDPALSEAILGRCRAAGYEPGAILRERCGLRPVRPEIRLERDGRIVHNYGHGGAGYTLSWGCAEDVVALARDA
ncbi:MAG: FAD-binding oxidoreductase [Chloroflexi bacterium]|nr:FAD-binding oxidoreductase [Chloroflexota bacterium]